jgi:hypothetical protein
MQNKRKAIEPWFEIAFVPVETEVVPIKITVWDEDDIDQAKDMHIDIDPRENDNDLSFEFQVSNEALTGDVVGDHSRVERQFVAQGDGAAKRRAVLKGYVTRRLIARR